MANEGQERLLAALDPEQREVAMATRGPVCVLAGAGTGKTRAVAHRIAYAVHTGMMDPARVLAVTFTTRAAGELRGRLRQLGGPGDGVDRVQARTFHAAALRQLRHFWPRTVGGRPPSVLDSKVPLLAEAARARRIKAGLPELRDAAAEIEWAKVTQVRPGDYPAAAARAGRVAPLGPDIVASLYAGYEELRRERHLVDFESVLELTAAVLDGDPAVAAEVRDRYRYFVVDEYQDVNPLQKLLLDAWAGDRDDVCVVGDPRQTIYSFTGATSAYLTGFTAEYPHATVVRLMRNYRSTPQVVALANRLTGEPGTGPVAARLAGLGRVRGGGGPAGALVAQRPAGPAPEFTEHGDEQAEAAAVAARAAQLIQAGVPPRQIAVLVRTNSQTAAFEGALAKAGVPCQVRGTERFFSRPEVRQAAGLLRAAVKSARIPGGGEPGRPGPEPGAGGPEPGSPGAAVVAEVRHVLAALGLTLAPPAGRGAARERWESLAALAQLAEDYCAATPAPTFAGFAAEVAQRMAIEHPPELESVTVASLHAAKGLEWDAVFLPGLTDGNVPIIHAQTDEEVAEERRLLYVGVTRARAHLFLSWSLARDPGGRRTRRPSRFLDGLPRPPRPGQGRGRSPGSRPAPASPGGGRVQASQGGGPAPASAGAAPVPAGASGPVDGALLDRLREWRQDTARAAGVPAFVVFTDDTLRRIAARRPATVADLAGLPGAGPAKLARYGAAVVGVCASAGAGPPQDGSQR